jgi:hypothetical protein
MKILGERRLTYSGSSLHITLPAWWCKHHKLRSGDKVSMSLDVVKSDLILGVEKNDNRTKENNSKEIAERA